MVGSRRVRMLSLQPRTIIGAAVLLLLVGVLAMMYQFRSGHAEREHQLRSQANTLAASVTAAIAFNDHAAAREYVRALMLDPQIDAVAVYDESGKVVAAAQKPGSAPIAGPGARERDADASQGLLLVTAPARQGGTTVGSVSVRGTGLSWMVRLARISGVALLTIMAVLMLTVLALAQRLLSRANARLQRRAAELTEANRRLTIEMDQRTRAEAALRQSQKMEAVGQLSGGIAHDFNNVLMVVKTALTLLEKRLGEEDKKEAPSPVAVQAAGDGGGPVAAPAAERQPDVRRRRVQRYLETAHDGIDKAAALTGRLLAFARQQPLSPKSVWLDELVGDMRTLLEHSVGNDITIRYELHSSWHVLCDRNQMENAILNLVINARDAMPDGGEITISTMDLPAGGDADGAAADCVRLRVADTGLGMSDEVRSRALDPFFTTKPVGKGTGLGLSTILGYVLQSRGHLDIDSTPAAGTRVDIVLPRDTGLVASEAT